MNKIKKNNKNNPIQDYFTIALEELFEKFPDPIFLYDTDDNFLYVNKAFADFHGLVQDEIKGKHISDIFPESIAELYKQEHNLVKKNLTEKLTEYDLKDINGNEVISLSYVKPFINKNGKILGVIGFARNIRDLKNLEEVRKKQDKSLKLANDILMNAPDLIFYIDKESRYQFVNKKYAEIGGLSYDDILGKKNKEIYEKVIADRFDETNQMVFNTLKEISYESDLVMNDRRIIVNTIKHPFLDENGLLQGIIGISREITKERLLEERYFSNQRIESLAYLANSISHDFNNILGAISGYTELLLQNEKNDEKSAYLERIGNVITKGNEITKSIMNLSDFGKIKNEPIKINKLIPEVVSIVKSSSSIKFRLNLEKILYPISGDQNQLFQVFLNVLTNSIESMPKGGNIEIKTSNQLINVEKGEFVLIEVIDQGTGIPEEDLTKIFDPFFSTKNPSDNQIRGLGLSMVYRIIQNHNGMVELVNNIDTGCTCRIYLPKSDSKSPKEPLNKTKSTNKRVKTESNTKTERDKKNSIILVIEDNADLLEIMKIRFGQENINGLFSSNPKEGIELFKKNKDKISLVILDYLMPELTGLEVFRRLKKINPKINAILVTGFAKDAIKSKDIGIIEIMSKPLDYNCFFNKIASVIN